MEKNQLLTKWCSMKKSMQRDVILEELRKVDSHPTADQLYLLVRERLPRVSLGTVYRNLEQLHQHGLVNKLEVAGNQKRWDGCVEPHYHRLCSKCGALEDFYANGLDKVEGLLDSMAPGKFLNYHLEFVGVCDNCIETNEID